MAELGINLGFLTACCGSTHSLLVSLVFMKDTEVVQSRGNSSFPMELCPQPGGICLHASANCGGSLCDRQL